MVKNSPARQETRVQSLGQEDPLENEMVTHSSILAWEILWTEEPVHGVTKSWTQRNNETETATTTTNNDDVLISTWLVSSHKRIPNVNEISGRH